MIDQVGDLKGIGMVWYYPDSIAKILSQFQMIIYSKWRMTYDVTKYYKSSNIEDLCYNIIILEEYECKFRHTRQELYVSEF